MKQTAEDKVPLLSNSDQQQREEMEGQGDIEKGVLAEPKNPFSPLAWKSLLGLGVFIYASYTILVHLCEVDGKLPFSTASMVLSIEVLKITISITALLPEIKENGFPRPTLSYVMLFAVPAILYALNNNISAHMQLQMDPATYQVLGNLKILSTAFLYRLIIKRPITGVQWVSLGLLATAGICNSYGGFQAKADEKSAGEIHITMKGLIMISIYCFISGLAGVYTEYILKRHYQTSIHLQNTLLYTFGIVLNGSAFVIQALTSGDKDAGFNPFHGYTIYTVLLIMSQAFCGLLMSAIFKHGNNITRLFIISCAMLVTTVLSIVIFGLKLNLFFCASFGWLFQHWCYITEHNRLCQPVSVSAEAKCHFRHLGWLFQHWCGITGLNQLRQPKCFGGSLPFSLRDTQNWTVRYKGSLLTGNELERKSGIIHPHYTQNRL